MILGKNLYKVGHPFFSKDKDIEQLLWTQTETGNLDETEIKALN